MIGVDTAAIHRRARPVPTTQNRGHPRQERIVKRQNAKWRGISNNFIHHYSFYSSFTLISLERQLASLCSLVHSALLPSNSSRRDSTVSAELAQLRAQIVEYEPPPIHLNGGGTPMVDSTTSTLSNGSAIFCNGERRDFGKILADLGSMKTELGELKREAQVGQINEGEWTYWGQQIGLEECICGA